MLSTMEPKGSAYCMIVWGKICFTLLELHCARPPHLHYALRAPSWCQVATIRVFDWPFTRTLSTPDMHDTTERLVHLIRSNAIDIADPSTSRLLASIPRLAMLCHESPNEDFWFPPKSCQFSPASFPFTLNTHSDSARLTPQPCRTWPRMLPVLLLDYRQALLQSRTFARVPMLCHESPEEIVDLPQTSSKQQCVSSIHSEHWLQVTTTCTTNTPGHARHGQVCCWARAQARSPACVWISAPSS